MTKTTTKKYSYTCFKINLPAVNVLAPIHQVKAEFFSGFKLETQPVTINFSLLLHP